MNAIGTFHANHRVWHASEYHLLYCFAIHRLECLFTWFCSRSHVRQDLPKN
jgi:hypothetical protein